jgi:predicted transcriptional regulator
MKSIQALYMSQKLGEKPSDIAKKLDIPVKEVYKINKEYNRRLTHQDKIIEKKA